MEANPIGFFIAIILSIVISVISWVIFKHKRLI
jgi:magnesium transporter